MRSPLLIFACVLACLAPASPALAGTSGLSKGLPHLSVTAATDTAAVSAAATAHPANANAPIPIALSNKVPAGRRLSPDQVLAIANKLPKMRAVRRKYPGSYGGVYLKLPFRWQVSYFSRGGGKEIGQVIIGDLGGRVLEQWTGFQVAWTMARGYPGAFGEHVNALYVWLPMCLLFILPFLDFRRPFALLHLDLLVLLSFSVSLAFFNHAHIYASVPLAYPPLLYLLARMLALLRRSRRRGPGGGGAPPLRLLVPTPWLAVGIVFLLGFRVGLNVTDSNVIDVGYAGVIGAQRIATDRPLYGSFPTDNEHGDTYGPFNYEAYVPFQQIFGWSGSWDDLPAAHGAAIFFDLLAIGLLFLIGRRMRGPTLGVALAYAWVSYPFTLFALESNTNDTLVAVLTLFALLAASYRSKLAPMTRGVFAALAGLTKLAPLALAPIFATHGLWELSPLRRARALVLYLLGFCAAVALAFIPALSHDSLHQIYERTLVYQANRGSPFSVWGLYDLHTGERIVEIATVVLVLALAVLPRRSDLLGLAAACAAAMIAVQLGMEHWFYLYIPWFFALAILVLLGRFSDPGSPPMAAAPSAPARSTLPEAVLST